MAAFRPRRRRTFTVQVALRFQSLESDAVSWHIAVAGEGIMKTPEWTVGRELFDRFPTGSRVHATVDGGGRLLWVAPAPG
jgi:hypothetical protein